METYRQHCRINEAFTLNKKNRLLQIIGRIMECLKIVGDIKINMATNGQINREELLIAVLRTEIGLLFEDLSVLTYFENLAKSCEDDFFFEALVSCIKTTHYRISQPFTH